MDDTFTTRRDGAVHFPMNNWSEKEEREQEIKKLKRERESVEEVRERERESVKEVRERGRVRKK